MSLYREPIMAILAEGPATASEIAGRIPRSCATSVKAELKRMRDRGEAEVIGTVAEGKMHNAYIWRLIA